MRLLKRYIVVCFSFLSILSNAQDVNDYRKHQEEGRAYIIKGEYEQAIEAFDVALGIMEYSSSMYYERGYAKMELEDYAGAIKDFSKVIDLAPHKYYAFTNRALVYMHLEQPYKAKSDIESALKLDPGNKEALEVKVEVDNVVNLLEAQKLKEYEAQLKAEETKRQEQRRKNGRSMWGVIIPLAFWSTVFLTW